MIEQSPHTPRTIAVHIYFGHPRSLNDTHDEFLALIRASGADIVHAMDVHRRVIDPRYLLGRGQTEMLKASVQTHRVELVIIDFAITPAQERNLERIIQCRVLDRIGLILDIFAQRAISFEGKLQVELAQLRHLSTRLIRGWTHLERQKGGIGLRGPGEKQLETDRRLLSQRIKQINRRLDAVLRRRDLSRRARERRDIPLISLIGYTNAGKSTLFNALSNAQTLVASQLFATLDTTVRRLQLPNKEPVALADTVGFVRDLPHELIAAFRATFEEVRNATLLLHVIDATAQERDTQVQAVREVLVEMGTDELPMLEVFNKIDTSKDQGPRIERDSDGKPVRVWLSSQTGHGLDLLLEAIEALLEQFRVRTWVRIAPHAGRLRSLLYKFGNVYDEQVHSDGTFFIDVEMRRASFNALCKKEGLLNAAEEKMLTG